MAIYPDAQTGLGEEGIKIPELRVKHPLRHKIFNSPLGRLIAGLLALGVGGGVVHTVNPDIIPAGVHWLQNQTDSLLSQLRDIKDNSIKPYVWSGEITPPDRITQPLPEALKTVQSLTFEQKKLYFLLPDQPTGTITFERKILEPMPGKSYEMTGLQGLEPGLTFVSPYDGTLMFAQYEQNGAWSINIRQIPDPSSPDKKATIEFIAQDLELLLSKTLFTTRSQGNVGSRTTYSSETPIRAGDPIFKIVSRRFVPGAYGDLGDYNLIVLRADLATTPNGKIVTNR